MTWLVTGGAGYIGAHVVRALRGGGPRRGRARRPVERRTAAFVRRRRRRSSRARSSTPAAVRARARATHGVHRRRPPRRRTSTPASRSSGRCTPTTQNVTGTPGRCSRRWSTPASSSWCSPRRAAVYGTPDVDLVTEDDRRPARVAVRRDQADRRVAARATSARRQRRCGTPRCATSTSSARARPTCTTPARTTCSRWCSRRSPRAARPVVRGADYPTPDGSCVRDYVHVADAGRRARRGGRAPLRAGPPARAGLQPRQRRGRQRAADHGGDGRGSPGSTSPPRSPTAVPATRPASSRPASWPPATSAGPTAPFARRLRRRPPGRPGRPSAAQQA